MELKEIQDLKLRGNKYSSKWLLDEKESSRVECLTCKKICHDMRQTACCQKLMCLDCLSNTNTCPSCKKQELKGLKIENWNKILEKLQVTCIHRPSGEIPGDHRLYCYWGQPGTYPRFFSEVGSHLKECRAVYIDKGEGGRMQRGELDKDTVIKNMKERLKALENPPSNIVLFKQFFRQNSSKVFVVSLFVPLLLGFLSWMTDKCACSHPYRYVDTGWIFQFIASIGITLCIDFGIRSIYDLSENAPKEKKSLFNICSAGIGLLGVYHLVFHYSDFWWHIFLYASCILIFTAGFISDLPNRKAQDWLEYLFLWTFFGCTHLTGTVLRSIFRV